MKEKVIEVKAETLIEAHRQVKSQVPEDLCLLSEHIISDGKQQTVQAVAETVESAYAKVQSEIPADATIMERKVLSTPEKRAITFEAYDNNDAHSEVRIRAAEKFGRMVIIKSLNLTVLGKKGFWGIGRTPNQYVAEVFQQAVVQIKFKTKAKIIATIGIKKEEQASKLGTAVTHEKTNKFDSIEKPNPELTKNTLTESASNTVNRQSNLVRNLCCYCGEPATRTLELDARMQSARYFIFGKRVETTKFGGIFPASYCLVHYREARKSQRNIRAYAKVNSIADYILLLSCAIYFAVRLEPTEATSGVPAWGLIVLRIFGGLLMGVFIGGFLLFPFEPLFQGISGMFFPLFLSPTVRSDLKAHLKAQGENPPIYTAQLGYLLGMSVKHQFSEKNSKFPTGMRMLVTDPRFATVVKGKSLKDVFGYKELQDTREITPEAQAKIRKSALGLANPFSTETSHKAGERLSFKCPSCSRRVLINLRDIDPINGVQATCVCRNVCHVPGGYKIDPNPAELKITAGVQVQITKFADWYFEHPIITSLIESGQSDLLYSYGLWAFCASCNHKYHADMLMSFARSSDAPNISFTVYQPGTSSAVDWKGLLSGHCSNCRHRNLIVIVTEIPNYVRDAFTADKK